jgi:hypothetical protein
MAHVKIIELDFYVCLPGDYRAKVNKTTVFAAQQKIFKL